MSDLQAIAGMTCWLIGQSSRSVSTAVKMFSADSFVQAVVILCFIRCHVDSQKSSSAVKAQSVALIRVKKLIG